jgi:hypothetical protein
MSSVVKEIGEQTEKATTAIVRSIVPVNVITWGVIPGVIAGIIILIILIYLKIPLSGTRKIRVCRGSPQVCEDKEVSNKYNILWYTLGPLIGGLIIGSIGYKIGIMAKNPKFGVGVVGAEMITGIFRK